MTKLKYILYCAILFSSFATSNSLKDVIKNNIYTNPQIKASVANYKSSLYNLKKANAGYNPSLDISAEYGKEHTEIASNVQGTNELNERQVRVVAKYNLFEGFKTTHEVEEKYAAVEVAKNKVFQKVNQVSLLMIKVYLDVLRRSKLLEIENRNLENHLDTLKKVKIRLEIGDGYESNFRQTKARVKLAQTNRLIVEKQYRNAEINYRKFMGRFPKISTLSSPVISLDTKKSSLETDIDQAHKNNFKAKIQVSEIQVSKAYHMQQRSNYYPTLDVEVSQAWSSNVHGFKGRDDSSKVALVFNYNLYSGGADKASELSALHKSEVNSYHLNEIQLNIEEQVRIALMQYELLESQEELITQQLDALKGTQKLYEIEYQHNKRTIIDLLNIKQEYTYAESQKINTLYDKILVYYQFKSSMGSLIHELDLEDLLER